MAHRPSADGSYCGKLFVDRFHVFMPSIPFAAGARRTRRRVQIEGRRTPFLSMEALAVFKMLFFRPTDLLDLERLLAVTPELDRAYVRRELAAMRGEDDERIARWDALASA